MVVGYSLGNKSDADNEIKVIDEISDDILTYSKCLTLTFSRMCRNSCPYCAFHRNDSLTVPYSTIKFCKHARQNGAREVLYFSGERPDKSPQIRATLDLWGFKSYLEYMYTVCELGFLEGLIPVIDVGFLTPVELKKMAEVCAMIRIMFDSVDASMFDKIYDKSPGKRFELRRKSLEWCGKLNVPVSTGLLIGIGESKSHRLEVLREIAQIHTTYGNIHEVTLQNFVPKRGTQMGEVHPPTKETMLEVVENALEILPPDISVTVPIELNPEFEDFVRAGIRDAGRIYEGNQVLFSEYKPVSEEYLHTVAEKCGLHLQQRFPLRYSFIKAEKYSKKLGQVFDAYRYKIKKIEQEKVKKG